MTNSKMDPRLWIKIAALVPILYVGMFIHELGHYLAIEYYGYAFIGFSLSWFGASVSCTYPANVLPLNLFVIGFAGILDVPPLAVGLYRLYGKATTLALSIMLSSYSVTEGATIAFFPNVSLYMLGSIVTVATSVIVLLCYRRLHKEEIEDEVAE
jgi:hypothetical protein